jgi:hypothetical protein
MDLFYGRRGDGPFRNFQSVYFEAYDAVKRSSPHTLVFPTFQYEGMIGALRSGERAQVAWSLVNRFEPKIDMLAVSSYPFLLYKTPEEIPANYYQPCAAVSTVPSRSRPSAGPPTQRGST